MKNVITILFIFIAFTASAQTIRFTNKTNIWNTLFLTNDGVPGSASYSYNTTDTFMYGDWYQYLKPNLGWLYFPACGIPSYPVGSAYVREDTIAQKVYYFSFDDSTERILYDYNMHIGDTIHFSVSGESFTDTVITMDSVLYGGYYYKIFNMNGNVISGLTSRTYTVLEGVGATNEPVLLLIGRDSLRVVKLWRAFGKMA